MVSTIWCNIVFFLSSKLDLGLLPTEGGEDTLTINSNSILVFLLKCCAQYLVWITTKCCFPILWSFDSPIRQQQTEHTRLILWKYTKNQKFCLHKKTGSPHLPYSLATGFYFCFFYWKIEKDNITYIVFSWNICIGQFPQSHGHPQQLQHLLFLAHGLSFRLPLNSENFQWFINTSLRVHLNNVNWLCYWG